MQLIYELQWRDFLDVAILTVVIYNIILMMQGTRTEQILWGITLLAVIYYLADTFGLGGISWVLSNFFSSIIIVIIVLFQADFRNALARVGTRRFFHRGNLDQARDRLGQIYGVCEHLAKTRTGALIVLEKDQGLREYYGGATELDARISDGLLVAIFNPKAPLHDGAVLVNREFRLTHAGCILPLSSKIDIAKNLGTRHRAAIGLSEESDALVLVVSEERGEISLAFQGELFTQSRVNVKAKLYELYAKTQKELTKERERKAQEEAKAQKDLEGSQARQEPKEAGAAQEEAQAAKEEA